MRGFLDGFVSGCKTVGCVYLSGETPQLKTKIVGDKLDVAGSLFALLPPGVVPIGTRPLSPGDRIVLVESSGPHENGFTSLRDLATRLPQGYRTKLSDGSQFWQAINAGSKLYTPLIQSLLKQGVPLTNVENITGHGWLKIMRSDRPLRYRIQQMLPLLPVFEFVKQQTNISNHELFQIFNCGTGMAIFVPTVGDATEVVQIADGCGLRAIDAGVVEEASERQVVIEPLGVTLGGELLSLKK